MFRGVRGGYFLPVCDERDCCGGTHAPVCYSRYHFLFFFNSGASVIHTSCFSRTIFLFLGGRGTLALDCQPSCRGSPTHRHTHRTASRTMRTAEPEDTPTMVTNPERKTSLSHDGCQGGCRPRHVSPQCKGVNTHRTAFPHSSPPPGS